MKSNTAWNYEHALGNEFYSNIEEPIREIVRTLRDQGINTTCSCGHDMNIQAEILLEGSLKTIHDVLYNYLADKDQPLEYQVTHHLVVKRGIIFQNYVDIDIGEAP